MITINLLPEDIKQKNKLDKENVSFFYVVIAFFVFIGLSILVLFAVEAIVKNQLDNTLAKIEYEKKLPVAYDEVKKETLFIKDRVQELKKAKSKKSNWSNDLTEIVKITPPSIKLTNFSIDTESNPSVKVEGLALNTDDIVQLKEQLDASPYFKDAFLVSSNETILNEVRYLNFQINLNLEKL